MFKDKILVDILTPKGIKKKKLLVEGKYIIVKQGKGVRGDPVLKAEFDESCILWFKTWRFGHLKQKLMWIEGHKKCVSFKPKTSLSYFDAKGYFDSGAIKNAGSTIQHIKIPLTFYLIIGAVLVMQIISLLISSGRVRIG